MSLPTQTALQQLLVAVASAVGQRKAARKLPLDRQTYLVRPDPGLWYTPNPSIGHFPAQEQVEEGWERGDLERFVQDEIKALPEFQAVAQGAADSPGRALLDQFVRVVAYDAAKGVAAADLGRHVGTLLADLAGEEREYTVRIWLKGVELLDEEIPVSSSLTLRRPLPEDLQERTHAGLLHLPHALRHPVHFSCIAEMRVRGTRPLDVQVAVDRLTKALRLFRPSGVAAPRYALSTTSFDFMSSGMFESPPSAGRLTCKLRLADATELGEFLDKISPRLPTEYGLPKEAPDFLSTALRWYEDALLRMLPVEGTIACGVACLEALFQDGDRELPYRLQMRVAGLLRHVGFRPLQVKADVKIAYDIRSTYFHGAKPSKKIKRVSLPTLFESVSDYARVCLLAVAQLRDSLSKERLLELIEKSLLDEAERRSFEELCSRLDFCRPEPAKT